MYIFLLAPSSSSTIVYLQETKTNFPSHSLHKKLWQKYSLVVSWLRRRTEANRCSSMLMVVFPHRCQRLVCRLELTYCIDFLLCCDFFLYEVYFFRDTRAWLINSPIFIYKTNSPIKFMFFYIHSNTHSNNISVFSEYLFHTCSYLFLCFSIFLLFFSQSSIPTRPLFMSLKEVKKELSYFNEKKPPIR